VVTALPHEFAAVCQVLGGQLDPVCGSSRSTALYVLARIQSRVNGSHVVAVNQMPEMGNNAAGIRATILLNDCPAVKHILMVGIAGAVPSPAKAEDHVRLGDIVVSDQRGVVQYDLGKETAGGMDHRQPLRPPAQALLQATRFLRSQEEMGRRPWEELIDSGMKALGAKYERPAEHLDLLRDDLAAPPTLHPPDPERRANKPRVFHGPIASANIVLKNPARRNLLRERFSVKAVEMEASGISDAAWHDDLAGYLVIRGTCDYCNEDKNDLWQRYAALIAAAYTRCVIEIIPGLTPEPTPRQKDGTAVVRKVLRELKQTLAKVEPEVSSTTLPPAAQAMPSPTRGEDLREAAGNEDTLLGFQAQAMLLRAAELPGLIRLAIRVWDVGQASTLGAELEGLLASVDLALVPGEKQRESYQALYDLEAAKIRGQTPAPAQSLRRMRHFLEKAKNVPGS
jgi:nucleoside phosphorylase